MTAIPSSLKNIQEYAEFQYNNKTPILAPKTYERYKTLLKNINMAIGEIKLVKLQSHHLQKFYNNLRENGGLSSKTILHHHRLISSILAQATRDRLVPFNVADRNYMKAPKLEHSEADFLDDEQLKHVLEFLDKEHIKWKTAMYLLIFSGIRRGELMGLEWNDIDFENRVIHIKRTSQ